MAGNSQAVHRVTKTNKRQDCFDDGAPSTVLHDSAPSHTSVDGAPSSQTFKTKYSILTTTFKITVYGDPYLSVLHIFGSGTRVKTPFALENALSTLSNS